jgi:hypothetical protein
MILPWRLALGALCMALVVGPARAQTVTEVASLSFGAFVVGGAGSVALDAQGTRSQTGLVYLMAQGGVASSAQFAVSGSPFMVYAITLPANGVVMLSDGQGHSVAINGFVSSLGGTGTLAGNGSGLFRVGATLVLGGAQAPGAYSGTFNIFVEYQ